MSKTEDIKQVTKVKNEGRQKAGHKLVEWNRKNKEDLKKNLKQEPTQDDSSVESSEISTAKSSEISTTKKSNDVYLYSIEIGILCLSLLAIGGLVYFKMPSKSAEETIEGKPIQQKIIRKML